MKQKTKATLLMTITLTLIALTLPATANAVVYFFDGAENGTPSSNGWVFYDNYDNIQPLGLPTYEPLFALEGLRTLKESDIRGTARLDKSSVISGNTFVLDAYFYIKPVQNPTVAEHKVFCINQLGGAPARQQCISSSNYGAGLYIVSPPSPVEKILTIRTCSGQNVQTNKNVTYNQWHRMTFNVTDYNLDIYYDSEFVGSVTCTTKFIPEFFYGNSITTNPHTSMILENIAFMSPNEPLPPTPLKYYLTLDWEFDDNFNDSTGFLHGTSVGSLAFSTDAINNKSLVFDASTTEYVYVNDTDGLDCNVNCSVELWVKPEQSCGALESQRLVMKKNLSGVDDSQTDYSIWACYNGVNNYFVNFGSSLIDTGVPNNVGTWQHIVYVMYDDRTFEFYVNGVKKATGTHTADNTINKGELTIGIHANSGGAKINPFIGKVDTFRFWQKALTQQEVTLLSQQGITYEALSNLSLNPMTIVWDSQPPPNNYNTNHTLTFYFNLSNVVGTANCSLLKNNVEVASKTGLTSGTQNLTYNFTTESAISQFKITCSDGTTTANTTTKTIRIDNVPAVIVVDNPSISNTTMVDKELQLNITITDDFLNNTLINISLNGVEKYFNSTTGISPMITYFDTINTTNWAEGTYLLEISAGD